MLFNSFEFIVFLVVVFLLYWHVTKSLRSQNILLLIASYFFYANWDWRFTFLLAFSTFLDFYTGIRINDARTKTARKTWLIISVVINTGFLAVFKYYNFFAESFADMLQAFGMKADITTISVILPVGISFYTFHGLSYVFDIYNRKITPTRNWVDYTLFVCFFPLLVAGPIERATHLLPQVEKPRTFDYSNFVDGLKQMLWGFFKKVVIADNCAEYVNLIFDNSAGYSGNTLFLGAIFFSIQIYGDFSGYSDIALGVARLFGFDLLKNFNFPYFSRDIAEFWRRWHISLSSWFRDYLYIPLGGSKGSTLMRIRNTFIIFLVSGFWHGANWTFIIWGALHAFFIIPSIIFKTNRNNMEIVAKDRLLPTFKDIIHISITYFLTVIAWIFFRAENVSQAFSIIKKIFSSSFFRGPFYAYGELTNAWITMVLIVIFMIIEWTGRSNNYAIETWGIRFPRIVRWSFYSLLLFLIGMYMQTEETAFIYFQF